MKKVLIVDDNANDRKLLRYNLERHGCGTVIEAHDGQQGMELAQSNVPDLIISDAMMPHMDGFQFLRLIKTDERLKSIPFVFHSSVYTGLKDEELAFQLGAEAFIPKPKEPEEFWNELVAILNEFDTGSPKHFARELMKEEQEYLKKYSEVVTAKLEEKVRELEEALARREQAEMEKDKLQTQLIQAQKMEAVGQLAGGIAHDFNNILTVIMGFGCILQDKMNKDDPLRPNVDQILAAAERAAHVTQSLLAFSRKQVMNPSYNNLNNIVHGVEKFLRRVIGEDIQLETCFTAERLQIFADSGQIEQVLMNLATNARDAMPNGGKLSLQTEMVQLDEHFIKPYGYGKAGWFAQLSVTDTGIGIDKELCAKIFEPFFTTKEMGKGTGLGLSMVYGIIKQHNGFINVNSEPGQGTTFRIYLPLINADQATQVEENLQVPRGGSEMILLAEDDPTIRCLLATILRDFGYKVVEAEDGEDALAKFREHTQAIQLLVLDVIMPRKSGPEAFAEIKNYRPDIPVLFLTGYTADLIRSKGVMADGCEVLMKPVFPLNLARKVREMLH